MKAKILPIVVLAILVGGGGTAYWYLGVNHKSAPGQIRVSGNIETTEAQVAFKIPGKVKRRLKDEGENVKKDEIVALLEKEDLEINVKAREAEVAAAKAAWDELEAGSRIEDIEAAKAAWEKATHAYEDMKAGSRPQEIVVAQAAVASAEADLRRWEANLRRDTPLYKLKTISADEYDATMAARDVAFEKHRQAIEQLSLVNEGFRPEQIKQAYSAMLQAKAQYDLVVHGPRQEDKDQAAARLKQAQEALALAKKQIEYATVYSPLTGVVLSKNIEEGEYVAPGTAVVTVGDLDNVWLRAYIEEPLHDRVKYKKAKVVTDSGEIYEGRVSFISEEAEFTPKNVQTQKERVKLVYRIKIDIKNRNHGLKPGMPTDAVIEIGE
jgi:HlyD family secretion protein